MIEIANAGRVSRRSMSGKKKIFLIWFCYYGLASPPNIQEVFAQSDYPNKPITIYVGFAPGGQSDISSRTLAPEVSKYLGQPVVIENKPGAGSIVATVFISKQESDGYRLAVISSSALVRTPHLQRVPFDPLKEVTPLIKFLTNIGGIFVKADSPLKSFDDLAKLAKSSKEPIRYCHTGFGSAAAVALEVLKIKYGFNVQEVPFQSDAQLNTAVLGGHILLGAGSTGGFGPLVKQRELRVLVLFSGTRLDFFPDVPTAKELGYDLVLDAKIMLIGPPSLPASITQKLDDAFSRCINTPSYENKLNDMGITAQPFEGSQALKKVIPEEYKMNGELIRLIGMAKK